MQIKKDSLKRIRSQVLGVKSFFKISVQIHGVPLNFFIQDQLAYLELKNLLPQDWLLEESMKFQSQELWPCLYWWSPPDNSAWAMEPSPDCFEFLEGNCVEVYQRDFCAFYQSDSLQDCHFIAQRTLHDGFFNFLRWYLPKKLLSHNKFIFHSSCVVNGGNGILFLGESGAGKTTTSSFFSRDVVLGDDMNLLGYCEKNQDFFVEPAFLGQRYYNPSLFGKRYTLKKLFWLNQSEEDKIGEVCKDSYLKLLKSCAQINWSHLTKGQTEEVLAFVKRLNEQHDVRNLYVSLSGGVRNVITQI